MRRPFHKSVSANPFWGLTINELPHKTLTYKEPKYSLTPVPSEISDTTPTPPSVEESQTWPSTRDSSVNEDGEGKRSLPLTQEKGSLLVSFPQFPDEAEDEEKARKEEAEERKKCESYWYWLTGGSRQKDQESKGEKEDKASVVDKIAFEVTVS